MHYLIEDATYPIAALGLLAVGLLIALKVTQQGKFLLWAAGVAALALAWWGVERWVVTNAERVEAVVYALADAVKASDAERVESYFVDGASAGRADQSDGLGLVRAKLPMLKMVKFDFLRVSQLSASAGDQTRRGSAEFKVTASGLVSTGMLGDHPFPPTNTEWSIGLAETAPGTWKINRITAISVPREAAGFFGINSGFGGGRMGPRNRR